MKTSAKVRITIIVFLGLLLTRSLQAEDKLPELTTADIIKLTWAKYASLTNYTDEGQVVSTLDGVKITTAFTIRLARPNLYRIEWDQTIESDSSVTKMKRQSVWSAGIGHYLQMADNTERQESQEMALAAATGISNGSAANIPGTFFKMNWGNLFGNPLAYARKPDEKIGDIDCYVIAGEMGAQIIWIGKEDLLIRQIRRIASAETMEKVEKEASEMPPKISIARSKSPRTGFGSTETHTHILVNQPLTKEAFIPPPSEKDRANANGTMRPPPLTGVAYVKPIGVVHSGQPIVLDGSGSIAGNDVTYRWQITAPPRQPDAQFTVTNADQAVASFTPPVYGVYGALFTITKGETKTERKFNIYVIQDPATETPYAYEGSTAIPYKTAPDILKKLHTLNLHLFKPPGWQATDKHPAILFFHGGGWSSGDPGRFIPECRYFSSRGMVAIAVEFRLGQRHSTWPAHCVIDAKSAVRYVRSHAGELGIDPDRIVAAGEASGGHMAACTATLPSLTTGTLPRAGSMDSLATPDPDVSCVPNALVLYYPTLNLPAMKQQGLQPEQYVGKATPPTLFLLGALDGSAPPQAAIQWSKDMQAAVNSRCRLLIYNQTGHLGGSRNTNNPVMGDMYRQVDLFLNSLEYLTGPPLPPYDIPSQSTNLYMSVETFQATQPNFPKPKSTPDSSGIRR